MAASDRAASARAAAESLMAKPAVQRAIQDPAVRDEARVAYEEARGAYERIRSSKHGVASSLLDDKKTQNALKAAGAAGLAIATALHEGPAKPKRKRRWGRLVLLALVGGALAIALSEGLRNKILDLLFGAEEEFDYVSTTAPPVAPQPPGGDGGVGQAAETAAEAGETTAEAAEAQGGAADVPAEAAEGAAKAATEEAEGTS